MGTIYLHTCENVHVRSPVFMRVYIGFLMSIRPCAHIPTYIYTNMLSLFLNNYPSLLLPRPFNEPRLYVPTTRTH